MVINVPADDGNVYSSGFVMAITEFKISGVNGVAPPLVAIVPTPKCDVLVTAAVVVAAAAADDADADDVAAISTFTIGIPFMLSLKL